MGKGGSLARSERAQVLWAEWVWGHEVPGSSPDSFLCSCVPQMRRSLRLLICEMGVPGPLPCRQMAPGDTAVCPPGPGTVLFSSVTITKYHKLGGLNNRHLSLTALEAGKSEVKVPVRPGEGFLPGVQVAAF